MGRFPYHKKIALVLSVIGNIGSLMVFKYLDFGIDNINGLLHLFGVSFSIPAAQLILPVGISFVSVQPELEVHH